MFLCRGLNIIVQNFILFFCGSEGMNILSDTDAACIAIALALCLKDKKKFSPGPKNGTNEETIRNENFIRQGLVSQIATNVCGHTVHHLISYSKCLPLGSLK
jgi:hypothetical protein